MIKKTPFHFSLYKYHNYAVCIYIHTCIYIYIIYHILESITPKIYYITNITISGKFYKRNHLCKNLKNDWLKIYGTQMQT